MYFEILNVEHGFAAYAVAEDDSVLLFDCGYSSTVRPADYLYQKGIRTIRRLFIMNYDEDHVGDLPALRDQFTIDILTANTSLSTTQLHTMKFPVSQAMNSVLDMRRIYTDTVSVQHPGIEVQTFCNTYPQFTDPNNLSLLVFLQMGNLSIALPGDLEHAGWTALLQNPQVCNLLQNVHVFVASHHGRETGYCREVFNYCRPNVIVFSDGPIQYDTQHMARTYGQHASGVSFRGQTRHVLTTRNDGSLAWNA